MLEAQVNESEHFFQTDETKRLIERRMAKAKETENRGDPFKCSSKVLSLDLLPQQSTDNGKLLAVVGESGFIAKKIDLTDKKVLQVFRGHNGPVSAVFAHGGFLVTGSWDKKIKKWDMETGKELLSLDDAHKDFVKTLVVRAYPSGKTVIYSGSADSSVRMWDFETGTALGRLEGHRRGVEAMVLDYAGEILFTASSDKSIRKFNVHTGECLAVFDGHETNIYSLFLNEDDEELWSASADKTVCRWNIHTGKLETKLAHKDWVKSVTLAGKYLITGSRDEDIRVWDLTTEKIIGKFLGHLDEVSCLLTAGSRIISGSLDGTIRQWNLLDMEKPTSSKIAVEETQQKQPPAFAKPPVAKPTTSSPVVVQDTGLTAEEEQELEELMN